MGQQWEITLRRPCHAESRKERMLCVVSPNLARTTGYFTANQYRKAEAQKMHYTQTALVWSSLVACVPEGKRLISRVIGTRRMCHLISS